jgi:hypothetical protein
MNLEDCTQAIRTKVGADSGLAATLKFDCGADGVIRIDGASTPTSVTNDNVDSDCTVGITLENLTALLTGDLEPTTGFMAGKLKVSVIHHDMGTVANTGDFTFKGNKKMLFALDAPSGKQKEPKDHKLKADLFGAKLSAAKVRSSATLQVLFRVKAFPKKGVTELAPVRPRAVLRAPVSLKAGQAARLL